MVFRFLKNTVLRIVVFMRGHVQAPESPQHAGRWSAPADAVFGVARIPRNERFKGSLRFLIAVLFPKRFGLSESWRRSLRREGGGRAQDGQQESHLSSASWVWANWSKSTPSCFLYSSGGMAAFSYLSLSICCSNSSFLASNCSLAGSFAAAAAEPMRSKGN